MKEESTFSCVGMECHLYEGWGEVGEGGKWHEEEEKEEERKDEEVEEKAGGTAGCSMRGLCWHRRVTAHSTQYTVHSTQYTVHSTQYTAHSTQHTAHSTQHTGHSQQKHQTNLHRAVRRIDNDVGILLLMVAVVILRGGHNTPLQTQRGQRTALGGGGQVCIGCCVLRKHQACSMLRVLRSHQVHGMLSAAFHNSTVR